MSRICTTCRLDTTMTLGQGLKCYTPEHQLHDKESELGGSCNANIEGNRYPRQSASRPPPPSSAIRDDHQPEEHRP